MTDSPLADRLRPRSLAEFVGQAHLVGANKPIRLMVKSRQIHSMIFWGPPGCGKTTLARLIAQTVKARFFNLSAVSAGKADIKKIVAVSHPRGEIFRHLGGVGVGGNGNNVNLTVAGAPVTGNDFIAFVF